MYVVYRVRATTHSEELDLMGARPGDTIFLRPNHATAPLSLIRDFDRNRLPLILGAHEALEVLDHSPLLLPQAVPQVLRAVVGDPTYPRAVPHLRLVE